MQAAGGHWGILTDGWTPRPFFASDSRLNHFSYGLQRTQPEPQHFGRKARRQRRHRFRKESAEKIITRGERLGGKHAAQDVSGRKDWPASLHHVSRKFDGYGHGGLPADHARCDRSPCGWLH